MREPRRAVAGARRGRRGESGEGGAEVLPRAEVGGDTGMMRKGAAVGREGAGAVAPRHRVAVDLVRRGPERTPPPLREPAVARARATSAPRARGSPAAPRLTTPPLRAAGARASSGGGGGGVAPAMGAPRLASAARRREQGRANAGRHGPAEDRRALRGRRGGQAIRMVHVRASLAVHVDGQSRSKAFWTSNGSLK